MAFGLRPSRHDPTLHFHGEAADFMPQASLSGERLLSMRRLFAVAVKAKVMPDYISVPVWLGNDELPK